MTAGRREVVVTGAGGFIGKHLVRDQLARGHSVTAIDTDLRGLEEMHLEGPLACRQLDVRATESLRSCLAGRDTVYHLAAAHLEVLADDAYFDDVNVRAAGELARVAAEERVRRFVHCSTVGVYGPLKHLPADEETAPAPDIAYERSKLAGEAAVREASARGGLSTVILRPAWVYGPLCPRTFRLLRAIARRRFFLVGDGQNRRHPIYISDMLDAFRLAATRELATGETLIIGGPETVTVRRLVELAAEELNMQYSPPRLPAGLMRIACLASEKAAAFFGRNPPISTRSLKFFDESSAFDIAKAKRLLDFEPRIDVREGLRMTIGYYRERGLL